MSFDEIGARFRKINAAKEEETPQPEALDPAEARTLRSRMLGVLIRDARQDSGYSEQDMANFLAVPLEDYMTWEYGYATPSLPLLEVLAYVLKIPVSHFWGTQTLEQQQLERVIDSDEYITVRTRMIGLTVRSKREAARLSQQEFADQLDLPLEHIQGFEAGVYQIPMDVLQGMANTLNLSLTEFLDSTGRVAQFFELQELMKVMRELDPDVRAFIAVPSNAAYIRLAMTLAKMPTESLRDLAEGLLDITL